MTEALWVLPLGLTVVAAAGFFAGWRSARAYLQAAEAVSAITNAVADQANAVAAAMDKVKSETALLRAAVDRNTAAVDSKLKAVEDVVITLFQGFERAGIVRGTRAAPGRQVGETGPE